MAQCVVPYYSRYFIEFFWTAIFINTYSIKLFLSSLNYSRIVWLLFAFNRIVVYMAVLAFMSISMNIWTD